MTTQPKQAHRYIQTLLRNDLVGLFLYRRDIYITKSTSGIDLLKNVLHK